MDLQLVGEEQKAERKESETIPGHLGHDLDLPFLLHCGPPLPGYFTCRIELPAQNVSFLAVFPLSAG
jgi:hypothetical protein